jgi:small subunit ribosomal protein S15
MAKTVKKEKETKKTSAAVKTAKPEAAKKAPKKETASTAAKAPKASKAAIVLDNTMSDDKQQVIKEFGTRDNDTGSPEVQVAILTWKIVKLQEHLGQNPKDNHSRRGLLKIISKRRRILSYLKKKDEKRYKELEGKVTEYQKGKSV